MLSGLSDDYPVAIIRKGSLADPGGVEHPTLPPWRAADVRFFMLFFFYFFCRSFLLFCMVLLIFMHTSTKENIKWWILLYFQETRNLWDLPQLSGKVKRWAWKNAAIINIVKVRWCHMEHSSTVERGSGFNFQSDKHKWIKCIVFVYVYLAKEPQLKMFIINTLDNWVVLQLFT